MAGNRSRSALPARLLTLGLVSFLAACAGIPEETPSAPAHALPAVQIPATPAPTAQEIAALRDLISAQDRLYRVAAPLLINNAELCRNHARPLLGFRAKNRYSHSQELANAAQVVLGLDERLRITGVLPGSGAERAGIMAGDILLTAEGQDFPVGENAERRAATLLGPMVAKRRALNLTVMRGEQTIALAVPLTEACAFNIDVGNAPLVNAYGDGFRILVTRGMLNTVQNDQELAYLLAKEMAHNVLGHASRQNQAATMGGIIDNLARLQPDLSTLSGRSGLRPLLPEFDTAADRLSLYLLARAGHPLDGAIPFWRRLAEKYPARVLNAYTALHPETDARLAAMEQAVRDIEARRADGRPLMPMP